MKFSNLMLFTGAALVSYQLVKNRQTISKEITETADIIDKVQANLTNIQRNMAIIQEQRENIKEIAQELSYKYRILEKQALIQIDQIKDLWESYE